MWMSLWWSCHCGCGLVWFACFSLLEEEPSHYRLCVCVHVCVCSISSTVSIVCEIWILFCFVGFINHYKLHFLGGHFKFLQLFSDMHNFNNWWFESRKNCLLLDLYGFVVLACSNLRFHWSLCICFNMLSHCVGFDWCVWGGGGLLFFFLF